VTQWDIPEHLLQSQQPYMISPSLRAAAMPQENRSHSLFQEPYDEKSVIAAQARSSGLVPSHTPGYGTAGSNVSKVAARARVPPKLNKDYSALALEYSKMAAYRDLAGDQACLLCQVKPSTSIFFPCGHKCACSSCMVENRIKESGKTTLDDGAGDWCFCPLCNEEIKRISLFSPGQCNPEDAYWEWVHLVKPSLPRAFVAGFKESSNVLCQNGDQGGCEATESGVVDRKSITGRGDGPRRGAGNKPINSPASGVCVLC